MLCRTGQTLFALVLSLTIAATQASAAPSPSSGAAVKIELKAPESYLIVRDPRAPVPTYYYARRSHFTYTAQGMLATREGMLLQGYSPNKGGARAGKIGDLQGPALASLEAPQPTRTVTLAGNLRPGFDCLAFDAASPLDSSLAHEDIVIYDDRGSQHTLTAYFSPCAVGSAGPNHYDNTYQVNVMAGSVHLGQADLFFDTDGRLTQVNTDNMAGFVFDDGLGTQRILTLDLGDPANISGNTGRRGLTCYDAGFKMQPIEVDGHAAGSLIAMEAVDDFLLSGLTAGGAVHPLGTLVTAAFAPSTRLVRVAPNIYQRTADGGDDLTEALQARYPGTPSSALVVSGNLPFGFSDASFDPSRPEETCTVRASTQLFAGEGGPWDIDMYFSREVRPSAAPGYPLRYHYVTSVTPADGSAAPRFAGAGTLYFDGRGRLAHINDDGAAGLDLTGTKMASQNVALSFDPLTVYAAPANLRLSGDGVAEGALTSLRIAGNGDAIGAFTNFLSRPLGRLPHAGAPAPQVD